MLIDELLVVCNDGLGDSLTNGVDLGCVSTTGDSNADINVSEFVQTNDQEGFVDLESQDLGLDEVERLSVNLNNSFPSLCHILSIYLLQVASSCSYLAVGDGRGCRYFVSTLRLN